jgi:hypothetical protein
MPGISSSERTFGLTNSLSGAAGMFLNALAKKGPAITMAGMAIIIPYTSVFPIFALNIIEIAVGEGWGGKKPWVTESAEIKGIPTYSKGKPVAAATVNIMGIRITKPTL